MPSFELYQSDNITPIAIAQPRRATWEVAQVGRFADGSPRTARYVRVVWSYPRLTEAQRQVFVANRPADGAMQFKTWRDAAGATPAGYVQCAGILEPITSGQLVQGEWVATQVVWTKVEVV